jgi:hypothetical protein
MTNDVVAYDAKEAERQAQIQQDKDADPNYSDRVANAELKTEIVEHVDEELDKNYRLRGHMFKNRDQSDLFHMLPLNKEQRTTILSILLEEKQNNVTAVKS